MPESREVVVIIVTNIVIGLLGIIKDPGNGRASTIEDRRTELPGRR